METNGTLPDSRVQTVLSKEQMRELREAIENINVVNSSNPTGLPFLSRLALSGTLDPRRDLNAECGYPETDQLTPDDYRDLFDREPVANRVVDAMPRESWQVSPMVYEDASSETVTDFEDSWDQLGRLLSTEGNSWYSEERGSLVWDYLYRADKLCGIGHFGIMLLGIDDGKNLQEPIDGLVTVNWRREPVRNAQGIEIGARLVKDGYREVLPDCAPTPTEIENLQAMVANAEANVGCLRWVKGEPNPLTKIPAPGSWQRQDKTVPLNYLNDWRVTTHATTNARRPAGFGKGPILRPGAKPFATQGDVGPMGSFTPATFHQGPGVSPYAPGSAEYQGVAKKPQKGGSRDDQRIQRTGGGAGMAPPYSPFIQGTDRQYSGSIPPGGAQAATPNYVGGHPAQPGDPAYPQHAQFVPGGHDPSTLFPSEQHAPMVPGYELGAGMGMPPAALSGTDQQYFGVQFGPSEQPTGQAGQPNGDDNDDDDEDTSDGDEDGDDDDTSDGKASDFQPRESPSRRRLLFLRVYSEELVQIVRYEWNVFNPRFGLPVMYRVTLNDPREMHTGVGLPMATVFVHWSRIIHLADNRMSSEIFGVPRLRPVLNPIMDIQKVRGAGAEGYWKSCFNILSFETHPSLGGDVEMDRAGMKDDIEQLVNGLQRTITTAGMTCKSVAPAIVDPTPHINIQLEAIGIQLGMPIRVLKGSERGELASSQDDEKWNDNIRQRQHAYVTPRVIVPFIDRLIGIGILPEPEQYFIEWPSIDSITEKDKVGILLQRTQAYAAYAQGLEAMIPPLDYLTRFDDYDEDEAKEILEAAAKAHEDETTMTMPAQVGGFDKEAPEGSQQAADQEQQQKQQAAQLKAMQQRPMFPGGLGGPGGAAGGAAGKPPAPGQGQGAKTAQQLSKAETKTTQNEQTLNAHYVLLMENREYAAQLTANMASWTQQIVAALGRPPNVHVEPPVVNVAAAPAPIVNVSVPAMEQKPIVKTITRDARGLVTEIHEGLAANWAEELHPRDPQGKFTSGGGGGGAGHVHGIEEFGHGVELAQDAHAIAEAFGGSHSAYELVSGAHEAAHHALEHGLLHAGHEIEPYAILARHLYEPALAAASAVVKHIPGGAKVAEGLTALHDGAIHLADKWVGKMEEHYGEATTAAILGLGSIAASSLHEALGTGGVGEALPGQEFIGALPLLGLAEVGRRLGYIGPDTKIDKGLAHVNTWMHAIRESIGKGLRKVETSFHKTARGAGATTRMLHETVEKSRARIMAGNEANQDKPALQGEELKRAAKEFWDGFAQEYAKLVDKYRKDLQHGGTQNYSVEQPRDPHGRWTAGEGGEPTNEAIEKGAVPSNSRALASYQADVKKRFDEAWAKDPERLMDEYEKANGPTNPAHPGTWVIGVDLARDQCPDYQRATLGKALLTDATGPTATKITEGVFERALKAKVAAGHDPVVLFTGGGPGAGKTTGQKAIPKLQEIADKAHIIEDSTFSSRMIGVIQKSLVAGLKCHVAFVYRDPEEAFKNGVIPRALDEKRTVDVYGAISSHMHSNQNFLDVRAALKDNKRVTFDLIDNSRGFGKAAQVNEMPGGKHDAPTIIKRLNEHVQRLYDAGTLPDATFVGLGGDVTKVRRGHRGD